MIAAAIAGVLTWTLLEYLIHRFLGHKFRKNPFGVEHVRHHAEGNYFAPTTKKIIAASVVVVLVGAPVVLLAGAPGGVYVASLIGFYTVYEWLHRREHTHAGWGPYGRWVRRHHFHHHFVDNSTNHGVTSPLWDLVFGTYATPAQIRVPRRLCMQWLIDPASGDVRREHAATYQLR